MTVVLIHGSWRGGWAWQGVIRHLEVQGHRAHAPTHAGHGQTAEHAGITHADCVNSVAAFIKQHDFHEVVLVGHSFGGSVISRVVEYIPDRIARLIFLDALVLEDGQSVYDRRSPPQAMPFQRRWCGRHPRLESIAPEVLLPFRFWQAVQEYLKGPVCTLPTEYCLRVPW